MARRSVGRTPADAPGACEVGPLRTIAIVQARMGSTRLPGKVLLPLAGRPMLGHIVDRLRATKGIDDVVVATSDAPSDDAVRSFCQSERVSVFSGSEQDVLARFWHAAREHGADPVLRVTGDCPFVDPDVVARLLALWHTNRYDHVGVATGAGALFLDGGRFPDGLDAECFSFAALDRAHREATATSDREHVTSYIWRNAEIFRTAPLRAKEDHSHRRWTVDGPDDLAFARAVYEALHRPGRWFGMDDVLRLLAERPELERLNDAMRGKEKYVEAWNPEVKP